MTDAEALDAIRAAWTAWAVKDIEEAEAMGRIVEALERCGRPVIDVVHVEPSPANDG